LSGDSQIGFKVRGLAVPNEDIVYDDWILLRGVPESYASYVFFRVSLENLEEGDKLETIS